MVKNSSESHRPQGVEAPGAMDGGKDQTTPEQLKASMEQAEKEKQALMKTAEDYQHSIDLYLDATGITDKKADASRKFLENPSTRDQILQMASFEENQGQLEGIVAYALDQQKTREKEIKTLGDRKKFWLKKVSDLTNQESPDGSALEKAKKMVAMLESRAANKKKAKLKIAIPVLPTAFRSEAASANENNDVLAEETAEKPPAYFGDFINGEDHPNDDASRMMESAGADTSASGDELSESVLTQAEAEARTETQNTQSSLRRPTLKSQGSSWSTSTTESSLPGMDAGKLGAAMREADARGAQDVVDPYANAPKPTFLDKFKNFFKSSAQLERERILAEPYESVPSRDRNAEEDALSDTGGLRRPEVSMQPNSFSSDTYKTEAPGMKMTTEIGEKMRATQELADQENFVPNITINAHGEGNKMPERWETQGGADNLKDLIQEHGLEQSLDSLQTLGLDQKSLNFVKKGDLVELYKDLEGAGFWAKMTRNTDRQLAALNQFAESLRSESKFDAPGNVLRANGTAPEIRGARDGKTLSNEAPVEPTEAFAEAVDSDIEELPVEAVMEEPVTEAVADDSESKESADENPYTGKNFNPDGKHGKARVKRDEKERIRKAVRDAAIARRNEAKNTIESTSTEAATDDSVEEPVMENAQPVFIEDAVENSDTENSVNTDEVKKAA